MNNDAIKQTAEQYLNLVRNGAGSIEESENLLIRLLDQLAYQLHFISFTFDDRDLPEPTDSKEFMFPDQVRHVFPNLSYYHAIAPVSNHQADPEHLDGDALDDIVDIARDLDEFIKRWPNSQADALWHLEYTYSSHWGEHLRNLQLYLYARKRDL